MRDCAATQQDCREYLAGLAAYLSAAVAWFSIRILPASASTGRLTDLFYTQAFSGSMATISKLNWVGALMSGVISVFSLLGICLIVCRIVITLMYLSGRNLFDQVHDIKNSNKGQVFGIPNMWSDVYNGNRGTGLDALVSFGLGLLPDIKMYSDYNDEHRPANLDEDDSITQYILKTSIQNIMMIFFLSIGFSGVLWQMFGTVVDAMSVAAERVANTNLTYSVTKLLNTDAYYQFSFGDNGSEWGELKDRMAKSMYNNVLRHSDNTIDGDASLEVGRRISALFVDSGSKDGAGEGKLSSSKIASMCGIESDKTTNKPPESEADNIKYTVIINSDPSQPDGCVTFPLAELNPDYNSSGGSNVNDVSAGGLYVHVNMYRKTSALSENYFSIKSRQKPSQDQNQNFNAVNPAGS